MATLNTYIKGTKIARTIKVSLTFIKPYGPVSKVILVTILGLTEIHTKNTYSLLLQVRFFFKGKSVDLSAQGFLRKDTDHGTSSGRNITTRKLLKRTKFSKIQY